MYAVRVGLSRSALVEQDKHAAFGLVADRADVGDVEAGGVVEEPRPIP